MKKFLLAMIIMISFIEIVSCGSNSSVGEDSEEINASVESNISQDNSTNVTEETSIYSEDDMYAVCDSLNKLLTSQWGAAGMEVKCYPTLEDDSVLIVALIDSVDKSQYTDDELLKLLQDNNIESGFINIPTAIINDYSLKNVVLELADKNGEMLYLFCNGDRIFQVGDESYDLSIKLVTPKEK